ncbi:60S ribosome subunit biogenesis protein NIP7 [Hordeum vulgare]|nr:60S ribosome subunit biogenesis protein NIP7 [Hordeum vulgare]
MNPGTAGPLRRAPPPPSAYMTRMPIGMFNHGGAYDHTVHTLDLLAAHTLVPLREHWNSLSKFTLARITKNTKSGGGVIIISMADAPLGFGARVCLDAGVPLDDLSKESVDPLQSRFDLIVH